jgi:hypothetical protein
MAGLLFEVQLALRDYDALEAELARKLAAEPLDRDAYSWLMAARVTRGDRAGARRARDKYLTAVDGAGDVPADLARLIRIQLLELDGDYAAALAETRRLENKPAADVMAFRAHLVLGQVDEAAAKAASTSPVQAGLSALLVSIGYAVQGDEDKARAWRGKACLNLAKADQTHRMAADLLDRAPDVRPADVHDVRMLPAERVVLLVALAQCCPDARDELLPMAEKLNYSPFFPGSFLSRAIAKMK